MWRLRGLRQPGEHTVGSTSGLCNEEKVQNELFSGKLADMSDASVPSPPTVEDVVNDLLQLRKGLGKLTVHKLVGREALIQLCGDGDIMDAYIGLKRDLERCTRSNKHEAAAAWSILADHETVMDRLVATAELLAVDGKDAKDQRSARAWSDRGMPGIARDLVEFAEMRGNLGQDLIGIAVLVAKADTIAIQVVQVASVQLKRRAPHVLIGSADERSPEQMVAVDLEATTPIARNLDEEYETRSYLIELESLTDVSRSDASMAFVEIAARFSPIPQFFLENNLPRRTFRVEFAVSRTTVTVKISKALSSSTDPGKVYPDP